MFLGSEAVPPRLVVAALNNGISNTEIKSLRELYDSESRPTDFFFIGRLTPKTKLKLLLDAMAVLEGTTLAVVGDGDMSAELRDHAIRLGIADRVTWHGPIVDERRIATIANRSRLSVYPVEVGLSTVHALAYGLPVVVHSDRTRHMPEFAVVDQADVAELFENDSSASLAQALKSALADPVALAARSAAAIALTDRTFNTDDMAKRFMELVERCADTDGDKR